MTTDVDLDIPALLDAARPDRYDPADKAWQKPVVDIVAEAITERDARALAAEQLVGRIESAATRKTNRLLREVFETGQWPVDWMDAMAWPLAIDGNERVTLRAATVDDLERFSNRERRAAANDFAQRNASCEGALRLIEMLTLHGVDVVADLPTDPTA